MRSLLLDRLVWFLRNVDLSQGLATVVEHYRDGIAAVAAVLDDVLPPRTAREAIAARCAELVAAGVPETAGAPAFPAFPRSLPPPISSWWPSGRRKPVADVAATYFAAAEIISGSTRSRPRRGRSRRRTISTGWRSTARSNSIGNAERRLTRGNGRRWQGWRSGGPMPGSNRARLKSSASARRSRRLPVPD